MNKGKTTVTTVINGPEVISSSTDKAKIFASIFTSNSTLDNKGQRLPNFPRQTEHDLSNILISVREVSGLIKSLNPAKATSRDNIPIIVDKNISPDLSPRRYKRMATRGGPECFERIFGVKLISNIYTINR